MITPNQPNRALLRVPAAISAAIYIKEQCSKKLKLSDLSSSGLSFEIDSSDVLPEKFEIRFKLTPFARTITLTVEVKSRTQVAQGVRVGCVFARIQESDKKRVAAFIRNYVNISFPEQAVNLAGFLCALDATLRILLNSVYSYYTATELGRSAFAAAHLGLSGAALVLYALFSALSFVLSSPSAISKARGNFVTSLYLLGYAFIFLGIKNFIGMREGFWNFYSFYATLFLAAQLLLWLYVGGAIAIGVFFLKKVVLTLDIIQKEFATLKSHLVRLKKTKVD
jgi:hypothetical protein